MLEEKAPPLAWNSYTNVCSARNVGIKRGLLQAICGALAAVFAVLKLDINFRRVVEPKTRRRQTFKTRFKMRRHASRGVATLTQVEGASSYSSLCSTGNQPVRD
ncbi:hypothetical protein GGR58DRAFT_499530 [Xylaria digitata]|nr:hypothetical protein GGR58DRAFT_499530 [Xylaria digitata]